MQCRFWLKLQGPGVALKDIPNGIVLDSSAFIVLSPIFIKLFDYNGGHVRFCIMLQFYVVSALSVRPSSPLSVHN